MSSVVTGILVFFISAFAAALPWCGYYVAMRLRHPEWWS